MAFLGPGGLWPLWHVLLEATFNVTHLPGRGWSQRAVSYGARRLAASSSPRSQDLSRSARTRFLKAVPTAPSEPPGPLVKRHIQDRTPNSQVPTAQMHQGTRAHD